MKRLDDIIKKVLQRAWYFCERCSVHPYADVVMRNNYGGHRTSNYLALCQTCKDAVERRPDVAVEQGWRVHHHRDPVQVPVWITGRGFVFLDNSGGYIEAQEESEAA